VRFVLDLGFGQRGAIAQAPVNGLLALVDQAARHELAERPQDGCLEREVHRAVRVSPVAEHAEALEVVALRIDEPSGELAAGPAELARRSALGVGAQFLLDVQLDRQAMAVPARHVRRVESGHRAGFHDEVLQDLV
jgi:hypothetical protein